ncbi:MAG: hypothetical protein ACK5X3_06795, partial [Pseudomonadota bacterium]
MADNVGYTPGTGATIAADDIGGVMHQRVKIGVGADGSATDVSSSNPMPVSVSSLPLPTDAATSANQPDIATKNPMDTARGSVVRQAPLTLWVASFSDVGSSLIAPELTQRRLGTGMGVTQASGNLVVTTGTTANSEFLARST